MRGKETKEERERRRAWMRALLADHLARYRRRSYGELRALVEARHLDVPEVRDADGVVYGIEVFFHWDGRRRGDIRVAGSIERIPERRPWWTGLWFVPYRSGEVYDDFILRPDGSFVGEDGDDDPL